MLIRKMADAHQQDGGCSSEKWQMLIRKMADAHQQDGGYSSEKWQPT